MSVMHAPCNNCPFLKVGGIRLRRERIKDLASNALCGACSVADLLGERLCAYCEEES